MPIFCKPFMHYLKKLFVNFCLTVKCSAVEVNSESKDLYVKRI